MGPEAPWPLKALDDLVSEGSPICYGVLKPGPDTRDGVALVRIIDLDGDVVAPPRRLYRITPALDHLFARSRLRGGEVLVSIQGTVGRVALVPQSLRGANISRTIARVAIGHQADARFVRYWLLSDDGQKALHECVLGTTRDSLNIGALRLVTIPTPPLAEQRGIAEILDAADEAIKGTEEVIAKGQLLGRALRATLLDRPAAESDTADVALGEIFDIGSGKAASPFRRDNLNGPVIVLGANGPIGSTITPNFHAGFILGRVGAVGVVTKVTRPVWASDNTLILTPKPALIDFSFAAHLLPYLEPSRLATRSAQPLITQTGVASLRAKIPKSLEAQQRIASILDATDARARAEERHLAKLKLQKQGLMQDLLTGHVRMNA